MAGKLPSDPRLAGIASRTLGEFQKTGPRTTDPALPGSQPAQSQPVTTSRLAPPPQPGAPTNNTWQPQGGFDVSGIGAAEDAYGRYGSQLAQPSAQEQYASTNNPVQARGQTATYDYTRQNDPNRNTSAIDKFAANNQPLNGKGAAEAYGSNPNGVADAQSSTASGQYWNSVQGKSNVPKDMSAYYDRASERAASSTNKQAAARGMYNSSAAMDQLSQGETDIRSQQAKDEAAYGLQSAQLNDSIQRGAAQGADSAGVSRYGAGLQGALGSDASGMSRYNSGRETAGQQDSTGIGRYTAGLAGAGQTDSQGNSLYNTGLGGAQSSDAGKTGRIGLLGQGAMAADTSRQGRYGLVSDQAGNLAGGLAATVGDGFGDMINSNEGLAEMGDQYNLGAGAANLTNAQNMGALGVGGAAGFSNSMAQTGQNVQNIISSTSKNTLKKGT